MAEVIVNKKSGGYLILFNIVLVQFKRSMKNCPHCSRPLSCLCVCRFCKEEVDPVKNYVLILIVVGAFVLGLLLGALASIH